MLFGGWLFLDLLWEPTALRQAPGWIYGVGEKYE